MLFLLVLFLLVLTVSAGYYWGVKTAMMANSNYELRHYFDSSNTFVERIVNDQLRCETSKLFMTIFFIQCKNNLNSKQTDIILYNFTVCKCIETQNLRKKRVIEVVEF